MTTLLHAHPTTLEIVAPFLGSESPNIIAKYDYELRAIEGIGLSDVEMDSVLSLVLEYVRGWAGSAVESAQALERAGQTDDQWWTALEPLVENVFDARRYPMAARVGYAATEHYRATYDPHHSFEFGLERLLDGIELFVDRASRR